MKYNHAMLTRLFSPVSPRLIDAATYHLDRMSNCRPEKPRRYLAGLYSDGEVAVIHEPKIGSGNGVDTFDVNFMSCTVDELDKLSFSGANELPLYMTLTIPVNMLLSNPEKYFLYRVCFAYESARFNTGRIEGDNPLNQGYIGITRRNPFIRLKEHHRDALNGTGHLFHKTWNSMLRHRTGVVANFMILDQFRTVDEAYDAEEILVDRLTLAPKGLNAIPGGMKGIRMMHQLRLLNGTHQVSVADRDAALVRLENQHHDRNSPCAHYRTGHFRTLPSGKMTWVSPCWVNPAMAV